MTRAEKLIAAARLARARKGYERSLAHDREREHARAMMYGAQDWDAGRDTEWARAFVAQRAKVEGAETAKRKAGDPLNLTGHTKTAKPSKVERKARAKAAPKQEMVVDGDGILRKVEVRGMPLRSGLEEQQRRAVEDFSRDWEMALRSMRCRGFEPVVAGKPVFEHLHRVQAQDRLRNLEEQLGSRDWTVLVAMVVYGVGTAEAHRRGAPQHVIVSAEIKRILNRVAAFYSPGVRHRDALLEACSAVISEMERQLN
ncbi:hypothetical protein [Xanthobacter sp. 126]|uniref:hypothetical protein n=1 Tax=Xanthobacter sp. 126 TaxID=1131814 RepID=UPI00045E800F|nr:hypothetical protein [Xanthobacter sp. 126]